MRRVRIISWLAGFIMLVAVLACGNNHACAWNGSGTEAAPYEINSAEDLKELATAVNTGTLSSGYFRQMSDIVFAPGTSYTAIGSLSKSFNGTYDGGNFVISGININNSSYNYQGMFGNIDQGGTIKNVRLVDSIIIGNDRIGGIAGNNKGTISDCSASNCTMKGNDSVGGIAGYEQGVIKNCSSVSNQITGKISVGGIAGTIMNNVVLESSYSNSQVNGVTKVGGVGGYSNFGTVKQCWNTGNITATGNYSGGICGQSYYRTIHDCYNAGSINGGTGYVGGIIGTNMYAKVRNCCNYAAVSGSSITGGVIGENYNGIVANNYFLQNDTINKGLYGIADPQSITGDEPQSGIAMQTDEFAYKLNTTGGTAANSKIWSRNPGLNEGLPLMADNDNLSICRVIFMNDNASYASKYSLYTGVVPLPDKPSQTNYCFGGWYTQENGQGMPLTESSIIDSDLTLYAYWFADPGEIPAFEMLGAEKRSEIPEGLRFKTRLYKNTLFANKKIKEYGTVILPSALIPAGQTLTLETVPNNAGSQPNSKIVIIPALNIYSENDDYLIFTGVLTNIPLESQATNITARAYVKYVDSNNAEATIYADPVSSSLSTAQAGQ